VDAASAPLALFPAPSDLPPAAEALIELVTNRLHSAVSRRGYRTALRQFLAWHVLEGGGPLSRALVQRYRVVLEKRKLAPSTTNQHLSAIRALCDESAESGLLDQPAAAASGRVKGVPVRGTRSGNWLTHDQAEKLLQAPSTRTLMGLRDRAILGLLIGCGLRRDELANLTFEHRGPTLKAGKPPARMSLRYSLRRSDSKTPRPLAWLAICRLLATRPHVPPARGDRDLMRA
jgi:integrase